MVLGILLSVPAFAAADIPLDASARAAIMQALVTEKVQKVQGQVRRSDIRELLRPLPVGLDRISLI